MTLTKVGTWVGSNFEEIMNLVIQRNKDAEVEARGYKLIIKDITVNYYCCFLLGEEVEVPSNKQSIIAVGVWDGHNINTLISAIFLINTEVKIKKSGKRLIINDTAINHYRCVQPGDVVEIPVYNNCCVADEYEEEILITPFVQSTELSNEMMIRWGLMKSENN